MAKTADKRERGCGRCVFIKTKALGYPKGKWRVIIKTCTKGCKCKPPSNKLGKPGDRYTAICRRQDMAIPRCIGSCQWYKNSQDVWELVTGTACRDPECDCDTPDNAVGQPGDSYWTDCMLIAKDA